ncbi:MAG: helix-turn-helix domain-containing protein [Pyrinomonadaceae bacterium]
MQLDKSTLLKTSGSELGISDEARQRCAQAKEQEEAGNFEAARQLLNGFWHRIGERPETKGLDDGARAEVLLRAGTLTGWIGSAQQLPGAQEIAKDLISESAGLFERLGLDDRVAEARIDLGICYWREGALDEARVTLQEVLTQLGDRETEQRLRALLNAAVVERVSVRYRDALQIHRSAAPLFENSFNHALRGKFHNEFAIVLKTIGLAEHREDYIDRALVEYAAAGFHFEEAGNQRNLGVVENNLGFLFVHLGRYQDAHEHLGRARAVAVALKDQALVAQFDDSRAKAFLGEKRYAEAEAISRASVRSLEQGGEQYLLAEALITHGTTLARINSPEAAFAYLKRGMTVAEQAGDPDSAGIAALTIIEELPEYLPYPKLHEYYLHAESLLARSQHLGVRTRLGECARQVLTGEKRFGKGAVEVSSHNDHKVSAASSASSTAAQTPGVSLEEQVLNFEGDLIRQALESSKGSVTRAARSLGITHQGLAFILNGRHKSLLSIRTPVKRRRRSIIRYR